MNNRIPKDEIFEVSDSTDWIETPLPSLSGVDSALRCQVCKDLYNTPMITSCNHSFCSLCIRRCLTNDGKCPACRTQDQELKLKHNPALEDVVEAFKRARPQVLEFARKPIPVAESSPPKRKRKESQLEADDSPRKKTRTSSRRTRLSQNDVVIEDSAGEDEDYIPEDDLVQCPICQKRMKEAAINLHLDRGCMDAPRVTKSLGRNGKQPASSAPPPPEKPIKRPERLPQINYQFVKESAMKKKLTDMGLSAAGNRQLLERRYTEWVTLWNANCDATRPKTKAELKRELDIWERTQGKPSSSQASGAQIKDKDFDGKGWSTTHDADFKSLIAKARAKVPAKTRPESTPDTAASSTPNPPISTIEPSSIPSVALAENERSNVCQEVVESSPAKARSRFFMDNDSEGDARPSSQYARQMAILEKDTSIASDIATSRPLQP